MNYNLLLRLYDYHCSLLEQGVIHKDLFFEIEKEYLKRKELFTICLN